MTVYAAPKPAKLDKRVRVKVVKVVKVVKSRKKSSKTTRQLLESKLDVVLRDVVLLRDGGCVCPAPKLGHSRVRQAGHLVKRGKHSVKYDLFNVSEQCSSCNGRHNNYPEYYEEWFISRFGGDEYARLLREGLKTRKLTIPELEELLRQFVEIHHFMQMDKTFKPRFTQEQILSGEWREHGSKNRSTESGDSEDASGGRDSADAAL